MYPKQHSISHTTSLIGILKNMTQSTCLLKAKPKAKKAKALSGQEQAHRPELRLDSSSHMNRVICSHSPYGNYGSEVKHDSY